MWVEAQIAWIEAARRLSSAAPGGRSPERVCWNATLNRTVAAWLALDWLFCQPLFECGIYARLPAWAARTKGADDLLIQANGNLLLRRLLARATRSSERRDRCADAATRSGDCFRPVDLGLSSSPSDGIGFRGCDLGGAKVR